MPSQLNITNIPAPRVGFIDPRTGLMAREWYLFFLNLFNLTGAGNNPTSLEDLQLGPQGDSLLQVIAPDSYRDQGPESQDQSGIFSELYSQLQLTWQDQDISGVLADFYQQSQLASIEARLALASGNQGWELAPPPVPLLSDHFTISFGTTGLLPASPTSGDVVVTGTLIPANGGTGFGSYAVGDLLYASGATALAKLADVAAGNALISGGVGIAPAWGKIGLTTHVSGVLPIANGGTNLSALGTAQQVLEVNAGATAAQWGSTNGSGNVVRTTSPTLVTPNIGAATGSSLDISGVTRLSNDGGAYNNYFETSGFIPSFSQYAWTGGGSVYYGTRITDENGNICFKSAANAAIGAHSFITRMRMNQTGSINFVPLAAAPASPGNGDVYYDSTLSRLRCWSGGVWNNLF